MDQTTEEFPINPETVGGTGDGEGLHGGSRTLGERLAAVFRGDPRVFSEVADDPSARWQALLVGGFAGSLLSVSILTILVFPVSVPLALLGVAIEAFTFWIAINLIGHQSHPYSNIFRVIAFTTAPGVLGVIPGIGQVAGGIYVIVLQIVAVSRIARVSIGGAIGIWLIAWVVPIVFVIGVVLVFGASVLALMGLGVIDQ